MLYIQQVSDIVVTNTLSITFKNYKKGFPEMLSFSFRCCLLVVIVQLPFYKTFCQSFFVFNICIYLLYFLTFVLSMISDIDICVCLFQYLLRNNVMKRVFNVDRGCFTKHIK